MRTPHDDDNYGKGSWNRPHDPFKKAENMDRINWECKTCGGSGTYQAPGDSPRPCPKCGPAVKSSKRLRAGVTRTTYK